MAGESVNATSVKAVDGTEFQKEDMQLSIGQMACANLQEKDKPLIAADRKDSENQMMNSLFGQPIEGEGGEKEEGTINLSGIHGEDNQKSFFSKGSHATKMEECGYRNYFTSVGGKVKN